MITYHCLKYPLKDLGHQIYFYLILAIRIAGINGVCHVSTPKCLTTYSAGRETLFTFFIHLFYLTELKKTKKITSLDDF